MQIDRTKMLATDGKLPLIVWQFSIAFWSLMKLRTDVKVTDAQRDKEFIHFTGLFPMSILLQQGTHPLLKKLLQLLTKDGGVDGLEFEFQNVDSSSRSTGAGVNHGDSVRSC